ncbi:MAG: permease [Epulopiscium sp.]|nr:permease [Candidatus Epulonipiscium sp.]
MGSNVKIPLFKPSDLDAAIGNFFDGFSKVIVAIAILIGTLQLDSDIVFGTMMPGLVVGALVLHLGLWWYYRQIAIKRNDPDLVAIPAGLQAGRLFIWLFSIMLPVYTVTGDPMLAFKVGVLSHFIGGFIFVIGAFIVPHILKVVPAGALFGALAGGAMAFMFLQSLDGILQMPVVGWTSLMILFVIYFGKVDVKLPAAFIAIGVSAIVAWAMGSMSFGAVTDSLTNIGFYLPKTTFNIFSSEVISATIPYLPIIIVFSVNEVITGIQAVEQARECGDTHFEYTKPIMIAGVASMVSALFGNPIALGLYWGYPGWKEIESGTGYHLGIAGLYAFIGLTGLAAIINAFIPEATVLPILVFIGMSSIVQAFEVVESKYYPAVILALSPVLIDFIMSNAAEGALPGLMELKAGSAFLGMIFGAILVFIIDNEWINVTYTSLIALGLTLIGMVHSVGIIGTETYAPSKEFIIVYIVTAIVFFILDKMNFNRKTEA